MSKRPEQGWQKVIESVQAMRPYKVPGNHDSHSQYNRGWEAACDEIEQGIEKMGDGWVSVEDELPGDDMLVNVACHFGLGSIIVHSGSTWKNEWSVFQYLGEKMQGVTVTHWRELPKPPTP